MCPTAIGPCFNRFYDREREYGIEELRAHLNLCEAQTDRMASVLLMPRFLVERTLAQFRKGKAVPLYGNYAMRGGDKLSLQKMADCMGVTFTALLTRLKTLNLIEYRDISEYIDVEMRFSGVGT